MPHLGSRHTLSLVGERNLDGSACRLESDRHPAVRGSILQVVAEKAIESIIEMVQIFDVTADYLLGTDCRIKTVGNKEAKPKAFTKEEVEFIDELKKYKDIYNVLIPNPKRGIDVLKSRIG